jgi:hypothetical protein
MYLTPMKSVPATSVPNGGLEHSEGAEMRETTSVVRRQRILHYPAQRGQRAWGGRLRVPCRALPPKAVGAVVGHDG